MLYIVTGLMRTGTSLMMQILSQAGIPPHYSEKYEARSKKGRLRNKAFLEAQECIRGDISEVQDGHCVKVFLNMLHKIDLSCDDHRVIAMRRNTSDRLRSMRQGMGASEWARYCKKSTHANVEVEECYDHLASRFPRHLVVDFNELFDNTEAVLHRVADYTGNDRIRKCRHVVEPKGRHYNSGE
jgi:hypothetical protein